MPRLPRIGMVAHYIAAAGKPRGLWRLLRLRSAARRAALASCSGDVCGIGPVAANDAALTRYTLRSFAEQIVDPAESARTG